MQIQERLIVPGLGVVILLAAFILGVPLVYKLLLALLGIAAFATYFAPHAVQVETRIAIAAIGLIILLIVSSTAFWLTLLSFAAIAALQIPHRHTLQRSLATVAWVNELLESRSWTQAGAAGAGSGQEAGAATTADGGEGAPAPAPAGTGSYPAFLRMDVAGIGSSIFGAICVVSVFLPWVLFVVSDEVESEGMSYTLMAVTEPLESSVPTVFLVLVLVIGLVGAASFVIPRAVSVIVGVAGLLVTLVSYFYLFDQLKAGFTDAFGGFVPPGLDINTLPHLGALLAFFCFLVILVLQLIPALNRPRG